MLSISSLAASYIVLTPIICIGEICGVFRNQEISYNDLQRAASGSLVLVLIGDTRSRLNCDVILHDFLFQWPTNMPSTITGELNTAEL